MTKPKKQIFHVYAKIALETCIEITANSLEDAITESKSLKVDDYISFNGEHCDSEMRVTGVSEAYIRLTI